jgi:hypothetical protein
MQLRRLGQAQVSYLKAAARYRLAPEFFRPDRVAEDETAYGSSAAESAAVAPSPAALRLLEVASADWFRPITEVYDAAGFRADEADDLIIELKLTGYATLHPVKTFKRGGQIKILLPTEAAISLLREARIRFMPVRGDAPHGTKGDATHIFYQHMITRRLRRQGWTAEIEMCLKDKRVDVGAIRGTVQHAYEVVNEGLEKELANMRDLLDGWQRIVFCVGNEDIRAQLVTSISEHHGDQVLESVDFRMLPSFR